jgi:hypothetical protein
VPRLASRPLSGAVVAALLVLMVFGSAEASAASSPAKSLSALVRQTKALPPSAVSRAKRRKLVAAVVHARKVAKRKPCSAVSDLARFRRILRGVKVSKGRLPGKAAQRLAALGPSSLKASQQLLGDKRTKRCGGGQRSSTRAEVQTSVLSSNENGLQVHVDLPVLRFVPETGGGRTWTRLVAPDTDSPGQPGKPGIPVVSSNFGIPDGATLSVTATNATSYTMDGVDVFPAQPDPVDGVSPPPDITKPPFATPAFTLDRQAYKTSGPVPANPADGIILGTARDLVVGGLQVPAAQYDPVRKTLKVFKSINVNIVFEGGPHTFSDELVSPWEGPQRDLLRTFLNFQFLRSRNIIDIIRRCGEEMLVITNPSTRSVADTFANAKRAQGMRTNVFETGVGSGQIGTTPAAIQTFIRDRLTALGCIRPSYVTIMGDDELVPTFTTVRSTIPSDLPYAKKNDADDLPDVALGRILGQDTTQLSNAVSKIVNYENSPPTGPMLRKATIAAQFQDDNADGREERTFAQFAETVRTGLVARGVTVDRIYQDSPTTTPLKFNDGTDLPAALKKPTFPWTGTGAQVTTAWNDGRFMVIHRDHGWSDGWVHPGFTTTDAEALTNGANLPVVMSINCSSAAYDYDETSFTQQALTKASGGAVGVFGDTRDSPTWHNSQLALGFVDALLPSVLPAEGPATKQRVGNALINGKLRLAGLASPATDGSTVDELFLWHYFGDPSMQMWGGDPPVIYLPAQFTARFEQYSGPPIPDPPPYEVRVTLPRELAGQPISLLRNGQVIGKAVAGDGVAAVRAAFGDGSVKPGDLEIAIEPDGGPAVKVPVEGVPAPQPAPAPEPGPVDTQLTQQCAESPIDYRDPMTTSGKLDPGFTGAKIVVKYTEPDEQTGEATGPTFEKTVTTDAGGNWSDTITPGQRPNESAKAGTWKVEARFEGDSGHKPSQGTACTVTVTQPT